ncbi:WG repeat-containing protein [Spirosoma luteum]|uniref:WG repeat-containing protein n=1 Tax=Spirosoma luteum TaxID=431553 RepID=UPI0003638B6C|nr:WG repeat-containing protein [Spirosoma luteum]
MKYIISTLLFTLVFLDCYSQDLVPFRVDTLWGYKDKQGAVKIEPQFQYATKFLSNVAIVAKNGKLGSIDKNNTLIIPFRYEFLTPLDTAEYLFGHRAKYFGEYIVGVMTKDEKVKIPAEYSNISRYRNTYLVTKNKDNIIGKNGIGDVRSVSRTYGLCDSNGKIIIPCKYQYISWTTDTLLVVDSSFSADNGKYISTNSALFSSQGRQLTGFDYMVFGKFIEGVAKARIGNKFGFIYPTGKIAIPIEFDYCEDFDNSYALIKQQDKWGAINKDGKIILEPKFDYQEVKTTLKEKYGR